MTILWQEEPDRSTATWGGWQITIERMPPLQVWHDATWSFRVVRESRKDARAPMDCVEITGVRTTLSLARRAALSWARRY